MKKEVKQDNVVSIDLIVNDLESASDFIEIIAKPTSAERVPGFTCYTFPSFDVMLSETALVDTGKTAGVILHVEVSDVDKRVLEIQKTFGILPTFGPENTDWGTYSAIYTDSRFGFSIDIFSKSS